MAQAQRLLSLPRASPDELGTCYGSETGAYALHKQFLGMKHPVQLKVGTGRYSNLVLQELVLKILTTRHHIFGTDLAKIQSHPTTPDNASLRRSPHNLSRHLLLGDYRRSRHLESSDKCQSGWIWSSRRQYWKWRRSLSQETLIKHNVRTTGTPSLRGTTISGEAPGQPFPGRSRV